MGLGESKSQVKVSDAKDQKEQLLRALLLLSLTHDQKWQAPEALLPFRVFFFSFIIFSFGKHGQASKQLPDAVVPNLKGMTRTFYYYFCSPVFKKKGLKPLQPDCLNNL